MTEPRSRHLSWTESEIAGDRRAARNGHQGAVVWLTGLSGAGKSTLATLLEQELFELGCQCYILDGDNVRHGLNRDLGFSPEDRTENIRRIGEVANLLRDAGLIVLTAFISPYRDDRARARAVCPPGTFLEVHCQCGLAECERRDPKGLYRKARAGEIPQFTGISAPYEAPADPEVVVRTDRTPPARCVQEVVAALQERGILTAPPDDLAADAGDPGGSHQTS
jgi:adenylylsulfate kinase